MSSLHSQPGPAAVRRSRPICGISATGPTQILPDTQKHLPAGARIKLGQGTAQICPRYSVIAIMSRFLEPRRIAGAASDRRAGQHVFMALPFRAAGEARRSKEVWISRHPDCRIASDAYASPSPRQT